MLKVKISISSAYFSVVETMADFFNRIGRFLLIEKGLNRPKASLRTACGLWVESQLPTSTRQPRERENALSVKISFDNELAVASIPLTDWAPPLVEHLGRYFDVSEGILRLDYAHLSAENTSDTSNWLGMSLTGCENFAFEFKYAARQGP